MPPTLSKYNLKWFLSSSDPWLSTVGFSPYLHSHRVLLGDDQKSVLLHKCCLPSQQLDPQGQMVCLILTFKLVFAERVFFIGTV